MALGHLIGGLLPAPSAERHIRPLLARLETDEGGFEGWVEKRLRMSRTTALSFA